MDNYLSTAEFARQLGVTPGTILRARSSYGEYFGIKPIKAANGRLSWPAAAVTTLLGFEKPAKFDFRNKRKGGAK